MFLIGISGSLLPYLLVGGIVLVFSFKASDCVVKDAEDENQVLESGHLLFSNDTPAPNTQNSFYFSPCALKYVSSDCCVHHQNKEIQSAVLPGGPPLFIPLCLRKIFLGEPVNTSRSSGFLFSGLSPPVSVIS